MKVKDLMELLKYYNPESEITFTGYVNLKEVTIYPLSEYLTESPDDSPVIIELN